MKITDEQVQALLSMLSNTKDDEADCGQCMQHMAEFAETTLSGKSIPAGLQRIDEHLESCGECREEFETLKAALGEEMANP
ncbi:MAG: hypothetical protein RH917_16215 [Lacipirellulaceae bacterium]